jgi:hypothetical protein
MVQCLLKAIFLSLDPNTCMGLTPFQAPGSLSLSISHLEVMKTSSKDTEHEAGVLIR